MNTPPSPVIEQTKNWVREVVIGLNLCPFAARPFQANRIDYIVATGNNSEQHLHQLIECLQQLDSDTSIDTSLLIFNQGYENFDDYLGLLAIAEQLIEQLDYAGRYQLASFHPAYQFEGSAADDVSNYTNRSPYPMLHLLREEQIEAAVASDINTDEIPDNNIKKLQQMGIEEIQAILKNISKG